jgi:uncharacterized membrane protein
MNNKKLRRFTGFLLIYGIIAFLYSLIGSGNINFSAIVLTISMVILFIHFKNEKIE